MAMDKATFQKRQSWGEHCSVLFHVCMTQQTFPILNSGMGIPEAALAGDMLVGKSTGTNIPPCMLPYHLPVLCMAGISVFAVASSRLCGV